MKTREDYLLEYVQHPTRAQRRRRRKQETQIIVTAILCIVVALLLAGKANSEWTGRSVGDQLHEAVFETADWE